MIVLERSTICGGSVEQTQLDPIHLNWIYEVPLRRRLKSRDPIKQAEKSLLKLTHYKAIKPDCDAIG